jgi:hypothetical protein
MTVGPTSPTRSTSSEPHLGQITRSEAWGAPGERDGDVARAIEGELGGRLQVRAA